MKRLRNRRRATVSIISVLLLTGVVDTGRAQQEFEDCRLEGYEDGARCGTVTVWEDPGLRQRRIDLRVVVLSATGPDSLRRPDPVIVLDGGPGQAASRSAPVVARDLRSVRRSRDLILPDRRGTGGSNPLDCPNEPDASTSPVDLVVPRTPAQTRACREQLAANADLTKYTTPFAAGDIVALADSLGIERFNLYGGSYGSREAFELARGHSDRVRSIAVFAVTPQDRRVLLMSPRSAETAMQRLIDDCMATRACRGAYPNLRRELDEVVARLEREPATFRAPLPGGNRTVPVRLSRTAFGSVLRTGLLSPTQSTRIPALIHMAHRGNFDPIGSAYLRFVRRTPAMLSRGLFLSVVCAEEMALVEPEMIRSAAEGTFWGDGWVRSVARQCEEWPEGALPSDWTRPPESNVPALLMSGWLDPIAPPAWAEQVRRHMPNARRVLVREGHHNFSYDSCARRTLARFFDRADAFSLDAECLADAPRGPFVIPGAGPRAGVP